MKIYSMSDEDATQVRAILLTHAELQDQQTIENESLRGRLSTEEGTVETIEDLEDAHDDLVEDRDNLKRLAEIFQ